VKKARDLSRFRQCIGFFRDTFAIANRCVGVPAVDMPAAISRGFLKTATTARGRDRARDDAQLRPYRDRIDACGSPASHSRLASIPAAAHATAADACADVPLIREMACRQEGKVRPSRPEACAGR